MVRSPSRLLKALPLTADAFSNYGEIIEARPGAGRVINQGDCLRFDSDARIDVSAGEGAVQLSVFRAVPREPPLQIQLLERHPLGSQTFVPLSTRPFLIVVAADGAGPLADRLAAFVSRAGQGINYRRGIWHHPLIALEAESDFLVIDRSGPGDNCEEIGLEEAGVAVTWDGAGTLP